MIASIVKASRPVSWINTAYPFAAGYLMVERHVDALLIVGTLFFLIPYNLLMYGINDVFDYESDLLNPRKGGIEGDVVRDREQARKVHRGIVLASVLTVAPMMIVAHRQGNTTVGNRARRRRVCSGGVLRAGVALQGAALPRLVHLGGSLCRAARVRARADGCGTDRPRYLADLGGVPGVGNGLPRLRGGSGRARGPRGRHRLHRHSHGRARSPPGLRW